MQDISDRYFRHQLAQEQKLARRPLCNICRDYISEDFCYEIDGNHICPSCADDAMEYAYDPVQCACCGEVIEDEAEVYLFGSDYYCADCMEDNEMDLGDW